MNIEGFSCTYLDRLLNRRVGIHAVLVVQINMINTQPLKAISAGLLDVFRRAVNDHAAVLKLVSELGRQKDLVAAARLLEPPPNELLVRKGAVEIARVPEGDAQVCSAREDLERFLVVLPAKGRVGEAHAHAAEALGGDEVAADLALGVGAGCHGCGWRGVPGVCWLKLVELGFGLK